MIDATLPLDLLPRYAHPERGTPWFACSACSCVHVRVVTAVICSFRMVGEIVHLGRGARGSIYASLPGSGIGVSLIEGRDRGLTERLSWLLCGGCARAFRADAGNLDRTQVETVWDVVEDPNALSPLGVELVPRANSEVEGAVAAWAALPEGKHVGLQLHESRLVASRWLDEPDEEGATGLHIHPANFDVGCPSWLVEAFDASTRWPTESTHASASGRRIAFDLDPSGFNLF